MSYSTDAKAEIQSGIAASLQGNFEEAIKILTRAVETGHVEDIVLYHISRAFFYSGRFKESITFLGKLLTLHRYDEDVSFLTNIEINIDSARYLAARMEVQNGQYKEAIQLLNEYCKTNRGDKYTIDELEQLTKVSDISEEVKRHTKIAKEFIELGDWSKACEEVFMVKDVVQNKLG